MLPQPPLLLITDRVGNRLGLREIVAAALAAGCRWVMARDKEASLAARSALVAELAELCAPWGASLLVNGAVTPEAGSLAAGLHLAAGAAPADVGGDSPRLLGCSAHDLPELRAAAALGADYATLSPIFATASKPGYGPALGLEGLRRLAREAPLPLVALGGIEAGNAAACLRAGAAGLAVMGGVMRSGDPGAEVSGLLAAMRSGA